MEHTFAFVDLAGFSALTETHGDETGADLIERFVVLATSSLSDASRLVGVHGDAIFFVAPTPAQALDEVARLFRSVEREPGFPSLRAGLHHGEAAQRGEQFYGNAVNVAARVAAHARGDQALGTGLVAAAARAGGLSVQSLGRVSLKNLREPLELFVLRLHADTGSNVVDPVCRMQVVREQASAHLTLGNAEYWFCSRDCLRLFGDQRP